ncbi:GMC family oxidoreductase [Frondihabitans peucedani]|uniref:GMC family oxidoreductase n=1 Tax=Frondihabitans peucedani TaxID=598626 RepID=A0ABP8DYF4_9MICO
MTLDALHTLVAQHEDALRSLVDLVVPRDDFPSASDSGALRHLSRLLDERPDWEPRITALVTAAGERPTTLESHPDWPWFAGLVSSGYYADPANEGNDGAASWSMIGWRRDPAGGWPVDVPVAEAGRTVITAGQAQDRYDAIVIGSGAGGGVAACGLAEQGRRVLVVESGRWPSIAELSTDHIRNPRSDWGVAPLSGPPNQGNPRVLDDGRTHLPLRPSDYAWSNNAMTAGGGTRVYGAQAWRFTPLDFRMASTYGVPDGAALADWPIGYDDLERYYTRAEREVGVSGDSDGTWGGHRSEPFPMPPLPTGRQRARLQDGADRLGMSTVHVPLLINSTPYLGRHACQQCSMCVGFACPVDAKNGSQNTMLTRAFATRRCEILLETRAVRLRTDAAGRVVGVTLRGTAPGDSWERDIDAAEIVVAAGAVESARLLLASTSDREPNGIGNNADQVGRHLQAHVYGGATALFDDVMEDFVGPGPSIATTDFRHGNEGLVGGGMIANEFVALPANIYTYLNSVGLLPASGIESKHGMRDLARRMVRLMGPIQEVTMADSRVRVDRGTVDGTGMPVAVLSGTKHHEDFLNRSMLAERSAAWLRAAGARTVTTMGGSEEEFLRGGPSGGQHQAGTCRMGDDPATSVVDAVGRVWGHDNLRVADGSVHVTNGGVNPVLTIFATALRTIEDMAGGWTTLPEAARVAVPANA